MVYVHCLSDSEKKELRQMTRKQVGRVAERARMILLSDQKRNIQDIAATFDCSDKTVRDWISRYETQGVNGIIKTANYSELITDIYGGEKYPLMAVMDIP